MKKINFSFLVLILLVISIAFSFYFNEDSTGGAKNDYIHHEKIIFLFAENFKETFLKYGTDEVMARNSPIFYILMSFFIKIGISIETLKYANSIIIPFYIFAFIECMKIRYKSSKLNENAALVA